MGHKTTPIDWEGSFVMRFTLALRTRYNSAMPQAAFRRSYLLALLCTLLFTPHAMAWIDTGHKIVALATWDELTPASKAKITEIIKQHPRYKEDLLSGLPEGASDDEAVRYAFATAATWPDMVRSQGHPMHNVANHPLWHYIDIPYILEGQPTPTTRPSTNPGPQNIVEALGKSADDLKSATVPVPDKAVALCWVLHLGGDIHQPLHGCTLYSPQFPEGDKGGNGFIVLRDPPYPDSKRNLHFIWDEMLGDYKSEAMCRYVAAGLRADPQLSRERLKDALEVKDPAKWAQESHELAVEHVYLKGKLQGTSTQELKADPTTVVPGLPRGYIKDAEQVATRRAALAAYRTADLLNSIFDPATGSKR
ncbi:MAG: hypothetical protein JWP03_4387 [Phycisphaerales bacterium]|jgi:hypothetical protein|nr:hypothetical protein [Phycisphaerales bacterium]